MGLASAWFPSRRSVDNHLGGLVNFLDGHVRSGSDGAWKAAYLSEALLSLKWVHPC